MTTRAAVSPVCHGKGRLESRSEAGGSGVSYGYDALGRLAWQADRFVGGTGDVRIDIGRYNRAGQIMERTRANLGTVAGQADLYAWTGAVDAEQAYDANGLNQYSRAGPATQSYDANGNLASETAPEGTTAYVYDVENRLVQASGAKNVSLRYDPLGRLYQLTGTATVAEYTGSGVLAERYVHGTAEGVDDPLIWYDGAVKRWLHADHQGSIVAVTDGAGAMHAINAYDEYGVPKSVNGVPANVGRFQYMRDHGGNASSVGTGPGVDNAAIVVEGTLLHLPPNGASSSGPKAGSIPRKSRCQDLQCIKSAR